MSNGKSKNRIVKKKKNTINRLLIYFLNATRAIWHHHHLEGEYNSGIRDHGKRDKNDDITIGKQRASTARCRNARNGRRELGIEQRSVAATATAESRETPCGGSWNDARFGQNGSQRRTVIGAGARVPRARWRRSASGVWSDSGRRRKTVARNPNDRQQQAQTRFNAAAAAGVGKDLRKKKKNQCHLPTWNL